MPEKITEEEINSMIETCIKAVNEGKHVTREQRSIFTTMLRRIGKSRGITYPQSRQYFNLFFTPQGMLTLASDLKLVTKPGHRRFLAQTKMLIEIESNLLSLVHVFPQKFRDFIFEQTSGSIEARWNNLSKLSGMNFSKLLALTKRADALADQIAFRRGLGKKEELQKRQARLILLEDKFNELNEQTEQEAGRIVSAIKGRLAAEFAKPDIRERLVSALKGAGSDASKREKEILQKYLKAHNERIVRQKPIRGRIQYR
ncbi:MAG: hypothetical protein J4415_00130 [Candidatus Diapherotrites archaeon]|uniref:Uncharacterized protein n=1 Tax=Candidatus Iainarchaeum sp. TaxID=3101447 RepID=A0A8T4KVT8_9ARCH|nr:hypothetical protein [Candidatus Diapherotrites archaeon]